MPAHPSTIKLWKDGAPGYMHRNPVNLHGDEDLSLGTPVKRGLPGKPEDWPWSSFRHYATGQIGAVEIESQWTAFRR